MAKAASKGHGDRYLDPDPDPDRSAGHVGSLLRGLNVLDMFSRDVSVVGIADMARELGVHKSSASRIAATLASAGYLRPTTSQGHYRLGPRLASLGVLANSGSRFEEAVMPHLRLLSEVTGETGHLAVLDGQNALTIGVSDGWHTVRMHSWVGKTSPAYLSSMGKVLLAGQSEAHVRDLYTGALAAATERSIVSLDDLLVALRQVRRQGYATDDEELEIGLRCVAAPIVDASGEVIAAISISGPSQRLSMNALRQVPEHVRWAAANASRAVGATDTPDSWPRFPTRPPGPLEWVEHVRTRRHLGGSALTDTR